MLCPVNIVTDKYIYNSRCPAYVGIVNSANDRRITANSYGIAKVIPLPTITCDQPGMSPHEWINDNRINRVFIIHDKLNSFSVCVSFHVRSQGPPRGVISREFAVVQDVLTACVREFDVGPFRFQTRAQVACNTESKTQRFISRHGLRWPPENLE